MKNAARFANDNHLPLFLLTARDGLLGENERVSAGGADLSDKEISRKAHLVARQLEQKGIHELAFLANPSNRLAIAYLRLITLACDRAGVSLEVLDHRGRPFAEWSSVFRLAEEAKRRASKTRISVREVFADLFRVHGQEDGMLWFKRGEAHRDRGQYEDALANFRQAAELFPMKEWRDAANTEAKVAEKHIPQGRSLGTAIQNELEEINRIVDDVQVKRLSSEAVRVAGESPSATILLSFAAMERIRKRLKRFPPNLDAGFERLRKIRNQVAHESLIGERGHADSFKAALFDILKFAYHQYRGG